MPIFSSLAIFASRPCQGTKMKFKILPRYDCSPHSVVSESYIIYGSSSIRFWEKKSERLFSLFIFWFSRHFYGGIQNIKEKEIFSRSRGEKTKNVRGVFHNFLAKTTLKLPWNLTFLEELLIYFVYAYSESYGGIVTWFVNSLSKSDMNLISRSRVRSRKVIRF